jgi:hypothetical protein
MKGENKASMTKGESSHGKRPAESVKQIENTRVGSPGNTGVTFKMPKDSECTDHSRVRDLD